MEQPSGAVSVRVTPRLSSAEAAEIRQLVESQPGAHDSPPVSERGLLNLVRAGQHQHLVAERAPAGIAGYAQLDPADDPLGAELVADEPEVAELLIAELDRVAAGRPWRLWSHGAASPTATAAERAGLIEVRALLQLRRPLTDADLAGSEEADLIGQQEAPQPSATATATADGIQLRAFVPGRDDTAWLALNARAFATHPEQGSWTEQDLAERIAADWFDPAGFLLAERSTPEPELVGFHWTKVHPAAASTATGQPTSGPLGEVYVLGVDPGAQGLRLGGRLLRAGLAHLRGRGLDTVLLYVERDNVPALALYRKAGFTDFGQDVQFARL